MTKWDNIRNIIITSLIWLFVVILAVGLYCMNKTFDKKEKLFDDWNQEQIEKIKHNR